ncbi:MAG TPA: DoxX family protein [Blastocatellia bacterium]|nr:DoxX family protein [Blastocatellia bacterium]
MESYKHWGYLLLRVSLGLIFLFYGLGKLMAGPGAFAEMMGGQFAKTPAPSGLVHLFSLLLPFLEIIVGVLVLLGLFTLVGLSLMAVLMMGLTIGVILLQQPQTVAQNLLYSLCTFFLIFYSEYNVLALDTLLRRRERHAAGSYESHPPIIGRPA